jgi:PEP-CTERM motif
MKITLGLAALLLSIGTVSELRAETTLLGDVISGSYDFPCVGCTSSIGSNGGPSYYANPFVVDGNVETVLFIGRPDSYMAWSVRFDANSLTLTVTPAPVTNQFYTSDPFNGPVFTVLSGNSFGSVTNIVENLHCTPCNAITAFVLRDSLYVNWAGAGGGQVGDSITMTFSVGNPVVGGVPEPSTWAMMLVGVAGLGFAFRRSRRKVLAQVGTLVGAA